MQNPPDMQRSTKHCTGTERLPNLKHFMGTEQIPTLKLGQPNFRQSRSCRITVTNKGHLACSTAAQHSSACYERRSKCKFHNPTTNCNLLERTCTIYIMRRHTCVYVNWGDPCFLFFFSPIPISVCAAAESRSLPTLSTATTDSLVCLCVQQHMAAASSAGLPQQPYGNMPSYLQTLPGLGSLPQPLLPGHFGMLQPPGVGVSPSQALLQPPDSSALTGGPLPLLPGVSSSDQPFILQPPFVPQQAEHGVGQGREWPQSALQGQDGASGPERGSLLPGGTASAA